ncbi:hypothetical protein Hanom_Chr17g01529971 [Helianthus anomalus]
MLCVDDLKKNDMIQLGIAPKKMKIIRAGGAVCDGSPVTRYSSMHTAAGTPITR